MPKRPSPPSPLPEDDPDAFDDELMEEEWQELEGDWSKLDYFDELEDWLDHEESWDEDKYGESH